MLWVYIIVVSWISARGRMDSEPKEYKPVPLSTIRSISYTISSLKQSREYAVINLDDAGQSEYSYRLAGLQTDLNKVQV